MRKKKILVIQLFFYPDLSAVPQLLGELLSAIGEEKETEWEFTVLCGTFAHTLEVHNKLPKFLGKVRIKRLRGLHIGKKSIWRRLVSSIAYYISVSMYLVFNAGKYDLVISCTTPPLIGFVSALATWHRNTEFIYYIQDLYPELLFDMGYIKRVWILKKLGFLNKFVISRARQVITIGERMNKKLVNNYGVAVDKLTIVPNWAPGVDYFEPVLNDSFVILYSGNFGLAHDFGLLPGLVRQFSMLDNICYHLIGGGKQFEQVQNIISSQGEDRILAEDYVSLEQHSARISVGNLLVIAQKESTVGDILPSKFYSYLAAGRPILYLGPKISEISQYIEEHQIGCTVEISRDIVRADAYLKNLINDKEAYMILCRKVRSLYETDFGLEYSKNRFTTVLESVLN